MCVCVCLCTFFFPFFLGGGRRQHLHCQHKGKNRGDLWGHVIYHPTKLISWQILFKLYITFVNLKSDRKNMKFQ